MHVDRQLSGAGFNMLELHWHKIPLIDADVNRVARTLPLVVNVPEELKRSLSCPVPCDHRIVAKGVTQTIRAVRNLGQMRNGVPR